MKLKKNKDKKSKKIHCVQCKKQLAENSNVLFVEEEIGRVFCSENCIPYYFKNEIEYFEQELYSTRKSEEFTDEEIEQLNELRWPTLDHPDEVWLNDKFSALKKTHMKKKDNIYTLISKYDFEDSFVWCVCITLLIRGFPSFLFISFLTKDESIVNQYRRGGAVDLESIRLARTTESELREIEVSMENQEEESGDQSTEEPQDAQNSLADPWTEEETLKSHTREMRQQSDIQESQFPDYEHCMESTLEAPDELWVEQKKGSRSVPGLHFFRFIKKFPANIELKHPEHYYIILARETDNDEELEIMDIFPTIDLQIVELYRQGILTSGEDDLDDMNYAQGGRRHVH